MQINVPDPHHTALALVLYLMIGPCADRAAAAPGVHIEATSAAIRSQLQEFDAHLAQQQWESALRLALLLQPARPQLIRLPSGDMVSNETTLSSNAVSHPSHSEEMAVPHDLDPRSHSFRIERYVQLGNYMDYQLRRAAQEHPSLGETIRLRAPDPHTTDVPTILPDGTSGHDIDPSQLHQLAEQALRLGEFDRARELWSATAPALFAPTTTYGPGQAWWWLARSTDTDLRSTVVDTIQRQSSLPGEPPGSQLADTWAKLTLVSIFQGDRERAEWELQLLNEWQPHALGKLGGREGPWTDLLREQLHKTRPRTSEQPSWTITGSWSAPLQNDVNAAPAAEHDRAPPFNSSLWHGVFPRYPCHPIVFRQLVVWHDHRRLYARDLKTGQPAWPDQAAGVEIPGLPPIPPFLPPEQALDTPCLLSLHGSMGLAAITTHERDSSANSFLVAFDLDHEGQIVTGFPRPAPGPEWSYASMPVSDGIHLYCALWKTDTIPELHLECLELSCQTIVWRHRICSSLGLPSGKVPLASLTFHAGKIIVNGNCGVMAAVRPDSGQTIWAVSYPRNISAPAEESILAGYQQPQVSPPLPYREYVLTLPYDSDVVMAMDASSGTPRWIHRLGHRQREGAYLIGAEDGTLFVGGTRLRRIDVRTGRLARGHENPYPSADGTDIIGSGRGALYGSTLFWPAQSDDGPLLWNLNARDGTSQHEPFPLWLTTDEPGNVLATRDALIVAERRELRVWHARSPHTTDQRLSH